MPKKPVFYQIQIKEALDEQWMEWFAPLIIHSAAEGGAILRGPIRDQSELHGILNKIRDLNLTLLAVLRMDDM